MDVRSLARPPSAQLLVGALAVLALLPSVAFAQARHVVLLPLEGRGAAAAHDAIRDGLRERGLVVDEADAPAELSTESVAALASARSAGAVIGGTASTSRRRWNVDLWVRDAAGGVQGGVQMRVRNRRQAGRIVARLAEELELVPTAASPAAAPIDPASTPSVAAGDAPAAAEPSSSSPMDRPGEELPIRALVLVGAGVRSRAFELVSPDGLNAAYRAEPYFEIGARASARFFDIAFVRAAFGTSIALDSVSSRGTPVNDTLFVWVQADVGASVVLGDTVELGAAFGFGWDRYQMQFNDEVPTAEYAHLRPALVTGFHLVGDALVLNGEIGVRIPFGVGDLESLYGVDHSVLGLDGVARLGGVIEPGFAWSIEAGARHYWLSFPSATGDITASDSGWHATGYAGWQF